MYLNKILFPAPHSNYKAKQFEDELFWVPREKHQKNFQINRKDVHKSEEKRKQNPHHSSKFMNLFKHHKSSKDQYKQQPKIVHTLNLETGASKLGGTLKEIQISKEKSSENIRMPITPQLSRGGSYMNEVVGSPQMQAAHKYSVDIESEINKNKKKKKKAKGACLGFFPKMHKNKKVTLEIFDESNGMPPPFNLDGPVDLKNFGPELAHAILNQHPHIDTINDSSSDSEEESASASATTTKKIVNIPCLHLKARIPTTKTMLYFHGNGEDLFTSYDFLQNLSNNLMINLVAMEYPGYGAYSGSPSEKKVLIDAETVYQHLINNLKIKEEDIFIFGRSIGSGPATWLASIKNPGLLILMSPFTSIRAVAKHIGGNLAKFLVKERFNNVEFIANVKCPVLFIHGKKDTLIPHTQAMKLYDVVKGKKKIHLAEEMTHSEFDFFGDISAPLTMWFKELDLFRLDTKDTKEQDKPDKLDKEEKEDIIKTYEAFLNVDLKLVKQSKSVEPYKSQH